VRSNRGERASALMEEAALISGVLLERLEGVWENLWKLGGEKGRVVAGVKLEKEEVMH
jgi:hypothetical protein